MPPEIINVVVEIRRGERNKCLIKPPAAYSWIELMAPPWLHLERLRLYPPNALVTTVLSLDALLVIDEFQSVGGSSGSRTGVLAREPDDGENVTVAS